MSEAYDKETSTKLVSEGTTVAGRFAAGVAGIGFGMILLSVASFLGLTSVTSEFFGVTVHRILGLSSLVAGFGVTSLSAASRLGYMESSPDEFGGVLPATVLGPLWFIVAGLIASEMFAASTPVWLGSALVIGGAMTATVLFTREDVGTVAPVSALTLLFGLVVVGGVIGTEWQWNPETLDAVFPSSVVVPAVSIILGLLVSWTASKAHAGYGAVGRQRGARVLISTVAAGMMTVLFILVAFVVSRGAGVVLENLTLGTGNVAAVTGVLAVLIGWRFGVVSSLRARELNPRRKPVSTAAFVLFSFVSVASVVLFIAGVELNAYGASLVPQIAFDWPFVMNPSQGLGIQVGVMPAVLGTFWLVLGAVLFAVPLAVGAAVYLAEYASEGKFASAVEVATNGLWSTPSIVFGLFGLAFLIPRFGNSKSIFAGQLVLGFMLLPLTLITSYESMKSVPDSYRDASAALGATQWQTIRSVVVPAAMPGVVTGVILGVGRIAGETAPLLLVTGSSPYPTSGPGILSGFEFDLVASPPFIQVSNEALMQAGSALPYQLYAIITAGVGQNEEFGWGTALVLLGVVLSFYAIGIASRSYFRRKLNE
jgi:phosphate transport system permease protein